jgi:hypothetical protein
MKKDTIFVAIDDSKRTLVGVRQQDDVAFWLR